MLLCLPLLSQQLQLCASPPLFFSCVWRLLPSSWFSSASSVLRSLNSLLYLIFFFFFLVSFLWFWVSLSSFLLLSPLLEASLLFFLLSVRSLLGAVAVSPPKKKKKKWCALHTKRALVTHSPYILPKYMFLILNIIPVFTQIANTFTPVRTPAI